MTEPAIKDPFVRLLLDRAKHEAAMRKQKVTKAACLSKQQIRLVIDTLWDINGGFRKGVSLVHWRTVIRIFVMYKSWCRFDCYSHLTSNDILFEDDAVVINFPTAKNDQFYAGTMCPLSALPDEPKYCPKILLAQYFPLMNFKMVDNEFLNCQITNKKGVQGTYVWKKVSYTTLLENSKKICKDMGF